MKRAVYYVQLPRRWRGAKQPGHTDPTAPDNLLNRGKTFVSAYATAIAKLIAMGKL